MERGREVYPEEGRPLCGAYSFIGASEGEEEEGKKRRGRRRRKTGEEEKKAKVKKRRGKREEEEEEEKEGRTRKKEVPTTRLELMTLALLARCSDQLS